LNYCGALRARYTLDMQLFFADAGQRRNE